MDALQYTSELVSFESTSSLSNVPVSGYLEQALRELGFVTERIEYDDPNGVRKACLAGKKGEGTGGVAYFSHSDVVPADPWFSSQHGPFQPTLVGNRLYGRGSCDMKGSIGCMLSAAGQFSTARLKRPIYFTCTADEEIGYGGAAEVVRRSSMYREMVSGESHGIIGEPTMLEVVYAHKGTFGFRATSRGRAAHSSTSHGINANLRMIPFLVLMKQIRDETAVDPAWQNSEFDPPTISWNIGINDHTRAINITPPQSICTVYYRPMPGQNADLLLERARRLAEDLGLEFEATVRGGAMYVDPKSPFVRDCLDLAQRSEPRTVAYGTDGAMFGEMKNLVVLGPGSIAQAHTHDEWIDLDQLDRGTELYRRAIEHWCC